MMIRSRDNAITRQRFVRRLLRWYASNGRDLPWRHTRDPYHILVSEIMLQQTQVSRVIPKYREWMRKYPSWGALADAPARQVREAWYPLGYNIRPVRLQALARAVRREYGGRGPAPQAERLGLNVTGREPVRPLRTL